MLDALDDAGLTPADVDGMVTFTMDSNTEVAVARATGIGELKFFSKIHHGGGAVCDGQQAAMAVATGVAGLRCGISRFQRTPGMRFGQVQLRLIQGADSTSVGQLLLLPARPLHAGCPGRHDRAEVHAPSGATSRDFEQSRRRP